MPDLAATRPLSLFYSYAHVDETLRNKLEKHLAQLKHDGLIDQWHDRRIEPGDVWAGEIDGNLNTADIVLLLVSADFLASDYCNQIELAQALEQQRAGRSRVIPVILRECDWTNAPFAQLQALPTGGQAVTSWDNEDEAFADIAKGIRGILAEPGGAAKKIESAVTQVTPKGLLSFDARDAGFFLQLVPPPLDRGLPRSIRFWKDRIEETDEAFRFGLMFGPSGCGKSSLVKAGLLPRLDEDQVATVYIEATGDDTETRLLAAIQKKLPDVPTNYDLGQVLSHTVENPAVCDGKKLLIVIDQFEQWLNAHRGEATTDLFTALSVCDGANIQCLLMIRHEFYVEACRLAETLGVDWQMGRNAALIDLFDRRHARHVLADFGSAYETLSDDLTADQEAFLDRAVDALADDDGRIVAVRLALFAEMVKGRDWTPATLDQVGGAEGVGEAFLRANFSVSTAPYRHHQKAAMAVLHKLLPATGTDIKGSMQRRSELQAQTKYDDVAFGRLIDLLVGQLCLVTPTDPADVDTEPDNCDVSDQEQHFQLTHDYLVPSIRAWTTSHLKSTRRGRAQLLLEDRTAEWSKNRRGKYLPGPVEALRMLAFAPWPKKGSDASTMLFAAGKRYTVIAVLLLTVVAGISIYLREANGRSKSVDIVSRLTDKPDTTSPIEFRSVLDAEAPRYRRWVVDRLRPVLRSDSGDKDTESQKVRRGKQRADAAIALLQLGERDEVLEAMRSARNIEGGMEIDPELQTQFVLRCKDRGILAEQLWNALRASDDSYVRFGLLLALGQFPSDELPTNTEQWFKSLEKQYQDDPSSAVHSATGWLLRQWGEASRLTEVDHSESFPYDPKREWFIRKITYADGSSDYFTFIVFNATPPSEFMMGSPESESGRNRDETLHRVRLTRTYAICDREVTVGQFERYEPEHSKGLPTGFQGNDQPVVNVEWNDTVEYCRWLTAQAGANDTDPHVEDEAIEGRSDKQYEFHPQPLGYRLPTEAEWEFACRAGTNSACNFGNDRDAAADFAWIVVNSDSPQPSAGKPPNPRGVFDIHGNVFEWCHDVYDKYPSDDEISVDPPDTRFEGRRVVRGGGYGDVITHGRSAARGKNDRNDIVNDMGFRLCFGGQDSVTT